MSFLVHRNGSNFGNHYFYCVHRSVCLASAQAFTRNSQADFHLVWHADSYYELPSRFEVTSLCHSRLEQSATQRILLFEFLLFAYGKGKSFPDIRHHPMCMVFFPHTACIEPHNFVGRWFFLRFFVAFSLRNQIELQLPKFNQKLLSFGLKTIFHIFLLDDFFDCWCWMYLVDVCMLVWWRQQTHSAFEN